MTMQDVVYGIFIPFLGTALGAVCVFFMKGGLSHRIECILSGFAAGVMVAASVFSLLIPAIESSEDWGHFASIPPLVGLAVGFLLLAWFDSAADRLSARAKAQGDREKPLPLRQRRVFLLTMSVTLHNLPEGMAVGVALAALLAGKSGVTSAAVFTLAMGIAIQNIPEGAIISLPLRASGMTKGKSFAVGVLSGIVEPIGAFITILAASFVIPVLPYLLGFAVGAMLSVVVKELIPHTAGGTEGTIGALAFALGFSVMTFLDVALG